MLCAISGEAPQFPVASRKSGTVYEKRLIEAYISENGTEPSTGESLTTEDLIDLKTSRVITPRPPQLTSIPSLLGVFQSEWDALALHTYSLQENLVQTRQELSTALYENEGAVRLIAKYKRERDEAREALAKVSVGSKSAAGDGDAMQLDSHPLPPAIVAKVEATQEKLMKSRRKRPLPEEWATSEDISSYQPATKSEPLYSGGSTLALHPSDGLALVGGTDGVAGVYSLSQQRVLQALKGGGGAITDGLWAGSKAIISTSAGKVKIFESQEEIASFSVHTGEASAIATHPSGDILASVGVDQSYVLYDLETKEVLTQVYSNSALTCVQFHPDGHLLAAGGADGQIKVFDVKSGSEAAVFDLGAPIRDIFFSENGIWVAAVTEGSSSVSIWDLRKSAEIKSLEIGGTISSISWDYTGQFLVVGGPSGISVQQYSKAAKEWSEPLKCAVPASGVTWGKDAQSILAIDTTGILTTIARS